ncbi:hypothetical protein AB1Y20_021416 [Prymnesium parvum]|uniref:Uncharacterized protein n=1 Tax=Prymnesium parvum TaxID=97485 RepID=A0AB34JLI5_PRYPA
MALTAEEHEASMECDEFVAASDAAGGKRPAEVPPPGEPAPTRSRPPDGPHEDSLGGAATHTLPTPHTTHPPEEDASAESLFGQSTHPSEGVTPPRSSDRKRYGAKACGQSQKDGVAHSELPRKHARSQRRQMVNSSWTQRTVLSSAT